MTRKQKQAHNHRELRKVRPTKLVLGDRVTITDFTSAPAKLETLMQEGRLAGVMSIYKLTGATPTTWQLGMMNGGMTIEEVFDLVCTMRRTMQRSYQFVDAADDRLTQDVTDQVIADITPKFIEMRMVLNTDDVLVEIETADGRSVDFGTWKPAMDGSYRHLHFSGHESDIRAIHVPAGQRVPTGTVLNDDGEEIEP